MLLSSLMVHLGLLACSLTGTAWAAKRHDFKTCAQSAFCNRNRAMADRASSHSSQWSSPYTLGALQPVSSEDQASYRADLKNNLFPDISFELLLDFTTDGNARIRVDEVGGLQQRFNEAADWTLVAPPTVASNDQVTCQLGHKQSIFVYGHKQNQRVVLEHSPLKVTFERDGSPQIVLNERGLFNMEHFRIKPDAKGPETDSEKLVVQDAAQAHPSAQAAYPHFLPDTDEGMWEEKWKKWTDTKPKGPESLSMDITFPGFEHVMGIPEHSGPMSLRTTRGGEGAFSDPYRLMNTDVFEYESDAEMALYGAIPFMQAHRPGSSVGIFWLNGAESWVDITKTTSRRKTTTSTQWISESGILDLFVFLGPEPKDVFRDFTALAGRTAMPQYFAMGHHQCRWNYLNEEDVLTVSKRFDEEDMPVDVIWLDIEYAEEHKYFVWDPHNFATPVNMLKSLEENGRQLVAIVDPHLKRQDSYSVYKEAKDLDILLKTHQGKEYEAICWTGNSAWIDFFSPKSWDWWFGQFKFDKWVKSARNLWIWNDMNEPAIFDGPEYTAPKDLLYGNGWENRDLHNINGVLFHNQTAQALIQREDYARRPFVLSRSFWAGSQRFGAVWTGDNQATWEHLAGASRMVLANGIGGMSFSGADIGGFFYNPPPDQLVRWYQAGAFHPFFRAHAHIDTKRREPYLYDDPIKTHLRDMLKLRYALLPAWYTAFWDSHREGWPIAMPHYALFPNDKSGIAIDDQYYLGHSGLVIKPIVHEGETKTDVYVPDEQPYYHYFSHQIFFGKSNGASHFPFEAPLDTIPLFHRGGSIVPRRDTIRRSAPLMLADPISLVVALDTSQSAQGTIYLDDGDSFEYEKGDYVWRQLTLSETAAKKLRLTSSNLATGSTAGHTALEASASGSRWSETASGILVSDITILGISHKPTCLRSSLTGKSLAFEWYDGAAASSGKKKTGTFASKLVIKEAALSISADWSIDIETSGTACDVPPVLDPLAKLASPLCPPHHFRCENKGHFPGCVLLSRVNDGICDPECCDGSDEFDGKRQCNNHCTEAHAAYKKTREEEKRKFRVGSSLRDQYIKFGQKEKVNVEKALARLEEEVDKLEGLEQTARKHVQQAESVSQKDIERKKASALYRRIEQYQKAIQSLRLDLQESQDEVDQLATVLVDLRAGYDPNMQDMAVKGAVRSFEEWSKTHDYPIAGMEITEETATVQEDSSLPPRESFPDDDLKKMEQEDILTLLEGSGDVVSYTETDMAVFRLEDYLPPSVRPHYQALVKHVLEALQTIGVLRKDITESGTESSALARARKELSDFESQIKKKYKKLEGQKAILDKDWGSEWEWKKLDGTCLDKNTGEYTYEICLFGSAKQKSNKGGSNVTLGKFASWKRESSPGSPDSYTQQYYDKGTKCWNGPERTVILDIQCGTQNELLSIMELWAHSNPIEYFKLIRNKHSEKCEYQLQISSPAACTPDQQPAEPGARQTKDEL